MNIADIFENAPDLDVKSIMTDSRVKCKKAIFFCIKGMVNDGHDFVEQAIKNGAICVVHSKELEKYRSGITYLMVEDTISALNDFAAAFYGNVTDDMRVYGVTGTNGKSTIAWITRYMVNNFIKCGYIGTIGLVEESGELLDSPLTTPDTVTIHSMLKNMYDKGCRAVSMEVSSIGLEEHRVDSVKYDVVSFTNLTHDHLDYHGNYENYYQAKKKLFDLVAPDGKGIINIDDEYGQRLYDEAACIPVSYAVNKPADYRAVDVRLYNDHTEFQILYKGQRYPVSTNLVAMFNVYNILDAVAMLHEDGFEFDQLLPLLKEVPQVLGRMENIRCGQPFNVIVDYAHTPDGFNQVFEYARKITPHHNRIICVFGCAGARDIKKRAQLGAIADEYCKMIVLTSEDPRMEDPQQISDQIREGIRNNVCMFVEDRYNAIKQAIQVANKNDTVLILGKGDENYMDIRGVHTYWMGDQKAAEEICQQLFEESEENDYVD